MKSDPEKDSDREEDPLEDEKPEAEAPPPLGRKIPEPPDNLRRRSDWFRKRSE